MKILRLALLYFDPFPERWLSFTMDIKDVHLGTIHPWSNVTKKRVGVVAEANLHKVELSNKNQVIIPAAERRNAEQAIEVAASMIAVSENCTHSISSPSPCIALKPENDKEREFLNRTKSIAVDFQNRAIPKGRYKVGEDLMAQAFEDRLDGVTLLAEALSQEHPTGRFHEFIRLFERAFKLSSFDLIEALTDYLSSAELGYTIDEIKMWIKDLRDPATHADGKYKTQFVLQSDIRPVIARIEQAAYDVLLNKLAWHDPSTKRKHLWTPSAGASSAGADVFIVQGKDVELTFTLLDEFGAYPLNLDAFVSSMPGEWWSKWPEPQTS